MSGARLTAGLECANDVGVRFTLSPSGDSQGPSRVFHWRGRVLRIRGPDGRRRAGRTGRGGSDPPGRGPGAGAGPGVFSHPCPRPLGVAPGQISLAGRLPSADVQVGESSTHRCSQARVLPVKQAVPSRRGRTRRRGDNAARTRQGPATHLGSPCARTRDHPGRHLAAGTAERPAALADAQDRRDHGR